MDDKQKRELFTQIFTELFPKVKFFACSILKSEAEAEDVAQDVFVKLWGCPDIWLNREIRNAYVYSMVRNNIYNILKHKAVEECYYEQARKKVDYAEAEADERLYAEEIQLLIQMVLEQMPSRRREIFLLSRREKKSNQEIADMLGLSVRTVEHHLYLALQQLKKIIILSIFLLFH